MDVKDLKDLEKLFKLCRKQGISEMDINGIKFKLGELPSVVDPNAPTTYEETSQDPYTNFPDGMLSPEQLAFYSSGGDPADDPENQGH
jgi:hypothetical protein